MVVRLNSLVLAAGICVISASLIQAQAPDAKRVKEIAASMSEGTFSSTPTIEDRAFWAKVGASADLKSVVREAEQFRDRPCEPLPDNLYLEYSKTGNRTHYEGKFFQKLNVFRTLVIAECVENKGRFIESIQQLIASYAKDKSWVLPAHDGNLDNFEGRQITIDLFASEVACELANADHILGDRLDAPTRSTIRKEAQRRIFEPYRKMVIDGQPSKAWLGVTNNWNAVCLANVTGCALALLPKPEDKAFFAATAEKYIANFLNGFTDDGYCSEGIGYWNYGFGCFVRLAHMLDGATSKKVELFASPKARSAGLFARRIEITPGVYPAFADCAVGAKPDRAIMAYVSRRFDLPPSEFEKGRYSGTRWLDELGTFAFTLDAPRPVGATEAPEKRNWFENAGILVCRGGITGTGTPVGVALKGGHNAEHHNHNDLGSFVYCIGRSMPLVDPGAEVYTKRTFSRDRYLSNVLNSFGHPVPRVSGKLQKTGRSAEAKLLKLDLTDARDTIQFDLTSAYPVDSLSQVTRTFVFERPSARLTVTDEVEFKSPDVFGTALITFGSWDRQADGQLRIGDKDCAVLARIEATGSPVKIDAAPIEEDLHGNAKPTRIGIELGEPAKRASITITIEPEPARK